MKEQAKEDLVSAAMLLRGEASDAWTQFLEAMRAYELEQTARIVDCAPDVLFKGQGMALAVRELTSIFTNAPELHRKMQDAKIGKTYGRRTDF